MADINIAQINTVASFLKHLPDSGHGLNFYSFGSGDKEIIAFDMYPVLNDPQAVNFFFFVCLHQYGFWHGDEQGYVEPLFGLIDGKKAKGSDLLWKAAKKALDKNPIVFEPEQLASIDPEKIWSDIFVDDSGPISFPDSEIRINLTHLFRR